METYLSTWGVIKAAGICSYLLLFVSVCAGAFSYGKLLPAKTRAAMLPIHQWSGWFGFLFGLLHGVVLLIDSYAPFSLKELVIPFYADHQRMAIGFGIVAFYMYLAVLVTSDWMKWFGRKVWRAVHYLPFPAYVFSLLHGFLAGSDTTHKEMKIMYAATGIVFILVFVVRIGWSKKNTVKEHNAHAYTAGRG
ncbi:ferric reductase-like transmembrane domain-containing protein [Paenibacillus guangzhouensis]|uniref:ferric reductase-like transmembrane domain-containing protein n=1 Tax=Paenibacillus guangzhouensis TaxID=1473112 RepID=UPI00126766DB|nr:ferric reductase-like transmembrane domain-containing protein [Paenibacillus guangzhouensis]